METTEAGARVRLGSRVTVMFDDGETFDLLIHGREHDLAVGVISATAPLAQSLLGSKSGESVSYVACGAAHTVTLLHVDAPGQ